MPEPYALTPAHRLILARAFRACPRVDTALDSAVEGQFGKAFVDVVDSPSAFALTVGPFWYFAGDATGGAALAMLSALPRFGLLMPSTAGWLDAARALHGSAWQAFPRFSFSATQLSGPALAGLLAASRHHVVALDAAAVDRLAAGSEPILDLTDFDSTDDFLARSYGFAVFDGERVMGLAYASLVCSHSIEVSVFVDEPYRRRGVATAVSAALLIESLERGLRPNWDAANLASCALAQKLGFTPSGTYEAGYFV